MRLIDADALIEEIQSVYEEEKSEDPRWAIGLRHSKRIIRDMPTVDVVKLLKEQPQRKTGHWKYYNIHPETEFPTSLWECGACNKRIYGVGKEMEYLFCPFCGAKTET